MFRIILIILTLLVSTPVFAQDLLRNLSTGDVETLLKSEGYAAVETYSDSQLLLTVDGHKFLITIFDDGDLQLFYGISGVDTDIDAMNAWNRTKRLSRAYIDEEGDPVLEADLLADRGITREQFVNFINVFKMSVRGFRDHLND